MWPSGLAVAQRRNLSSVSWLCPGPPPFFRNRKYESKLNQEAKYEFLKKRDEFIKNYCGDAFASSPQDCPAESGDFRAQQCSAHNDIKHQGVTYEWVPAPYDPTAPCTLRCQAKGRSLTVELAPKVLDGTRCRADAFDMCISGACQVRTP